CARVSGITESSVEYFEFW
nr:immunoglobulin heavy chain junction region [Macaca mulatta]MOX59917.1 immunoglobulin heavy chain junction region [Macaca mulatta]MOX60380.1 immunoglobulin heavy chain junction region [Macaca mulatta]MOX60829.1 immunoglobulin heavy chain junction region [Macaca mulatta]MOX61213.1 immunoglobulin heavy chain junction region [Macaca mulatta]